MNNASDFSRKMSPIDFSRKIINLKPVFSKKKFSYLFSWKIFGHTALAIVYFYEKVKF